MNVAFIGYRCSGKTTISKALSFKLNWNRVELDREIEKKHKKSIPQIVKEYGWEEFRKTESELIKKYSSYKNIILDLGGGAILNKKNISCVKKTSILIFLECSITTVIGRLKKSYFRPPLTDLNLEEETAKIYTERLPLYKRYSDYVINSENLSIEQSSSLSVFYLLENRIFKKYHYPVKDNNIINTTFNQIKIAYVH